jgi:hypothetical protein
LMLASVVASADVAGLPLVPPFMKGVAHEEAHPVLLTVVAFMALTIALASPADLVEIVDG